MSSEEIQHLQTKAEGGDVSSQLKLAKAYQDGDGVSPCDIKAFRWYRAAAERGDSAAQNEVATMYASGRGVGQDKIEAVSWYRKSARQNNPVAMFNLGSCYYNGDGVAINDITSYAWFLLAQSFGSRPAEDAVARMKREATRREADALELVGDMYQGGDDLPQNLNEAINWYQKAAEIGSPPVQMKLANLLLKRDKSATDYAVVRALCEKASKTPYGPAAYCMGRLYAEGLSVQRDRSMAAKWFTEGAKLGNAMACLRLGQMYWNGEGLKQDKIAGYEFVYLASTSGLPEPKLEEQRLVNQLKPKEVAKAKAKATEWDRQYHPLILRGGRTSVK